LILGWLAETNGTTAPCDSAGCDQDLGRLSHGFARHGLREIAGTAEHISRIIELLQRIHVHRLIAWYCQFWSKLITRINFDACVCTRVCRWQRNIVTTKHGGTYPGLSHGDKGRHSQTRQLLVRTCEPGRFPSSPELPICSKPAMVVVSSHAEMVTHVNMSG
jgi:hypothetical protein